MKGRRFSGNRINIMQLVWNLGMGGLEKLAIDICSHLPQDQFSTSICVLQPGGAMESRVDSDRVDLLCVRQNCGNDPTVPFRLARLLRKRKIDVLHSHAWGTLLEGIFAAKLARVPAVIHSEHSTTDRRRRRIIAQRAGWGMLNQVVAVSDAVADRMTNIVKYPRNKIHVIPNGVDLKQFRRLSSPRQELREQFGLSSIEFLIGMVARFMPFKNHAGVLQALPKLHAAGIDAHLALAGSGPLREQLENLSESLGITDKVHFLGNINETCRFLNSLDVFVSNSTSGEGLSLAVLEAMACEVPVLATAVAEHPNVLNNGRAGSLIPPENEDALVEALLHLAKKPEVLTALGQAGRRRVLDKYSYDGMMKAYQQLYRRETGIGRLYA
ncbi:glycosyltransferase [Desulfobacter curvatus]|uniref:glycosyltransferase n=1 Tax=Desulfobacter curvatus TaxID=2290 RepID=UPI000368FB13|nr:glycosyltransferase [Desulfobacter curvatus]